MIDDKDMVMSKGENSASEDAELRIKWHEWVIAKFVNEQDI
jgi:hypothetical protein